MLLSIIAFWQIIKPTETYQKQNQGSKNNTIAQRNNTIENIILHPYLGVKIPIARRIIDPDKIGIQSNQATSTALQLNIPLSTKKSDQNTT